MQALDRPNKVTRAKASNRKSEAETVIAPAEVIAELEKHILVDGFKMVFDPVKSRGSRFVDAASGRELIDLYSFYASQPIGFNHPYFDRSEVKSDLLTAAKIKVANPDVYTVQLATFVQTFSRVVGLRPGHERHIEPLVNWYRECGITPKFELVPISKYLSTLPKALRPSIIPAWSTPRPGSSRMMSAASLATSTAPATEIPTSAVCSEGASLMPSPMKPTT